MYLAPKKLSIFRRARGVVLAIFFVVLIWVFGGKVLVALVARVGSMVPQYISSTDATEVSLLKAQLADSEQERALLNAFSSPSKRGIVAPVSVTPGYFFGDALLLDRGESSRVSVGNTVVTESGVALGTIERVGGGWSSVLLISRPGKKTTVRLSASETTSTSSPAKNILVDAEGAGGGELRLDLPVSLSIAVGSVAWWGEHPEYPIGVVDRVDQAPARQIQSIFIRLPVSLPSLAQVIILP